MNIYACPEAPQYYHVGHIPDAVRAGTVTRAQWLANAAARDARMRGDAIRRRVPDVQDRGVVLDMLGLTPRTRHATVPRTWRQVGCPWCGVDSWDDCRSGGSPSRKPHQSRITLAAANPHEGTP